MEALLVKARSRPVEGDDSRRLPKWIATDIVTHSYSPEETLLGGIRHERQVAGGKYRVKLGMIVMSAGRIGAWSWKVRKPSAKFRSLLPCMYMTNMLLLRSCIAVSAFEISQWQND
jgi:hypothetical protein